MEKVIEYLKNIRKIIKISFNKLNSKKRNKMLRCKDFTIISNNCFAGLTYEYLSLPFNSPTIGLYFFAPDYIKFIKRLKYYIGLDLIEIETKESKYYNELKRINQENVIVGKLEDVEIIFLHYKNFDEAKEKWIKRCNRINYDKIIYKFNDQNLCTQKELEEFNDLDLKNKICFTSKKYNYEGFVQIKKYKNRNYVLDDAFCYHKYFDIIKYVNVNFSKKRILHILFSNKYSGAENVACTIIESMNDIYEMYYCSPRGQIEEALIEKNISYIPIGKLSFSNVRKVIKDLNPDIIHAHDNKATVICSFFGTRYKVISHIHGNNRIMNSKNLKTFIFNLCSKRIAKFIWVSDSSLDNYIFKNNILAKSVVLYNIVDRENIVTKASEYNCNKEYDLIFLGRLGYPKNPERLIKIIKLVKQQKKNISVAIVGDGPERSKVESLINNYNLKENVKLYGFQTNPFPILKNSKMLIITSIYEGTPMCALEAQSLAKPIVATPVDGLKNIVFNGFNGYLLKNNDEFVKVIVKILNDKKVYNEMSKNSAEFFSNYNDIDKYISIIRDVYECEGNS